MNNKAIIDESGNLIVIQEIKYPLEEDVDLRGTGITSLPKGVKVGGNLDLDGCSDITALPDGLKVGGWLDLRGTGIKSLPDDLDVGGEIYKDF